LAKAREFMSNIETTIIDIIAREAAIEGARVKPESTLKDLEISSIDAVQIIFAIEDNYKISLPYNEPGFDVGSVAGLVAAVEKLVAESKASA
jgi:acyl carrier protein